MKDQESLVRTIIESIGFRDYAIEVDEERRHGKVFIYSQPPVSQEHLPVIVESLNHIVQLIARKENEAAIFFDVNNYRRERESLISDLARAAARKALATKGEIALPAMNSYERRLIHVELAAHPGVMTESVGAGRTRSVVVRPIQEKDEGPLISKP